MNKWITGLFATALISGVALADAGAPAVSAKDLSKAVEKVNYVETDVPGVKLNGYVDVGYTYNFIGKSSYVGNRFGQDSTPAGDFNVNAVKLTLEKPLNNKNELQAGFRVDAMLGEDAGNGLGGNNGSSGSSFGGSSSTIGSSSLLLEQAYVVIRAPYGNGIDFKVGKQVTWLGYEVIERPSNLNITYGNLFQNMIPLYGTGVSAEYKFNDMVDGGLKINNGWNADSNYGVTGNSTLNSHTNTNDGYGIEAKLNIKNKGGNANIQQSIYYSWDSSFQAVNNARENGNVVVYDVWGNWAPKFANDKLLLGFNTDLGYADLHTGNDYNPDNRGTTWWGAALYAKYQFNSIYSLAGRADYIHSDDTGPKFGTGTSTGYNGYDSNHFNRQDLWSLTLTNSFNIVENLLIRAEYRVDFGDNTTAATSAYHESGTTGSSNIANTVSLEAVYTF